MATTKMTYRFWATRFQALSWCLDTDSRYTADNWYKMMTTAFKHGINFFDNAENYTAGYSEELTGLAP
ncbi:NADP-dependent oxidoreductase domain [Phytophthora cactorum]|nr:NADP-dependent oxidoreductase domain [Phytophthora cactorum]